MCALSAFVYGYISNIWKLELVLTIFLEKGALILLRNIFLHLALVMREWR